MKIIWTMAAFFFSFHFSHASVCSAELGRCAYYRCLGQARSCPAGSLMTSVAQSFCKKFEQDLPEYSFFGQGTLSKIKICLQQVIEAQNPATCAQADAAFVAAHVQCYPRSGYCQLGLHDQWLLARTAWPILKDIRFNEALWRIETACLSRAVH